MDQDLHVEHTVQRPRSDLVANHSKLKPKEKDAGSASKRRCVSTACVACRRRKSKCDGAQPSCAACSSVYMTPCEYAPHTDHRRKGVYKKDADSAKTKSSSLQVLIHALLNLEEEEAIDLVREIRACDNLEELAQLVENREKGLVNADTPDSPIYRIGSAQVPQFEAELSGKMGDLVLDGSVKFIGGTSNLIWLSDPDMALAVPASPGSRTVVRPREEAILSWSAVTQDKDAILHFLNMYFCWHYSYFTTLSKELFYRDFLTGTSSGYCSPLLVNAMLALGCHFSSWPTARSDPDDGSTTGEHFFTEAKRLLHENDEFATPKLCTVQALALMSVREAGCGRESRGWVYSGMSFRMASELGLNIEIESANSVAKLSDEDVDARRITIWGCYFFDKCWSNYLGRQPQLLTANMNVKKPDVFPSEESEMWSPYSDTGIVQMHTQPARTRAIALQNLKLGEISSSLLIAFYQPQNPEKPLLKQLELKKLTDIHTKLEAWKRDLPAELDPGEGQLPQVLLMHMFYQLLYIHLYRPFLRYTKAESPLPSHISPRKFCTQAAGAISKLFRLYKRTHGLRQICNIAVYIAHSACTIHLLNLPDKNARRDIVHGVKHLEEIGEGWICARRTLEILALCAEKWKINLPDEVYASFSRTRRRWSAAEIPSSTITTSTASAAVHGQPIQQVNDTLSTRLNIHQQRQQHEMRQQRQDPRQVPFLSTPIAASSPNISTVSRREPASTNSEANVLPLQQMQSNLPDPTSANPPDTNRLRAFAQLTKEQQDVWNAHQARMAGAGKRIPKTANKKSSNNAAVLFGGVDTLIEDSQDWWLNDQSQIATGFDNWHSPSTTDWSMGMGLDESGLENSTQFLGSEGLETPYESAISSPTGILTGFPASQSLQHSGVLPQQSFYQSMQQQQQQQQQTPRRNQTLHSSTQSPVGTVPTHQDFGTRRPYPGASHPYKRTNEYINDNDDQSFH